MGRVPERSLSADLVALTEALCVICVGSGAVTQHWKGQLTRAGDDTFERGSRLFLGSNMVRCHPELEFSSCFRISRNSTEDEDCFIGGHFSWSALGFGFSIHVVPALYSCHSSYHPRMLGQTRLVYNYSITVRLTRNPPGS